MKNIMINDELLKKIKQRIVNKEGYKTIRQFAEDAITEKLEDE